MNIPQSTGRVSKMMRTKRALEGRLDHAYMTDSVIESMELEEQIQSLSMKIARLHQRA